LTSGMVNLEKHEQTIRQGLQKLSELFPDQVADPWGGHITRVNLGPKIVFFHTVDEMIFMFEMIGENIKLISKAKRPI